MDSEEKAEDVKDRLNRLYLSIIMRYRSYIEERENLSVAELPRLITPSSDGVSRKVSELKGDNYVYESGFYDASNAAVEFIKSEIDDVMLPVQFWIMPDEVLRFKMGDQIDKSTLLCSMLIGLGNPSAKVLIDIKEDVRKAFVYYEFNGSVYLFSIGEEAKVFASRDEMIEFLDIDEESTIYEFNDKMFVDIS